MWGHNLVTFEYTVFFQIGACTQKYVKYDRIIVYAYMHSICVCVVIVVPVEEVYDYEQPYEETNPQGTCTSCTKLCCKCTCIFLM